MAYDGTIPALGNLISNDIPAMQENFSLLESAQIVDSGSTADGDYWRFEDGLQICISNTVTVDQSTIAFQNIGNYPFGFLEVYFMGFVPVGTNVTTTEREQALEVYKNHFLNLNNSYFDLAYRGATESYTTVSGAASALAIGRWK